MKRYLGNLVILLAVLLTILVWIIFPPENDGRANFQRQYAGEIIGSINIVLLSFYIDAAKMGRTVLWWLR
jgi:cadmium resistance protein CadD (predicted permease)